MAGLMGVKAVQCLVAGEVNKVIAAKGGDKCVAIDIEEALATKKTLDEEMLLANEILSL
jgi:6-phosphofructokinase